MKISILGAGNVGNALGTGWAKRGHEVTFGVRDPGKKTPAETARAVAVKDAAQASNIIVLAVPKGSAGCDRCGGRSGRQDHS